MARIQTTIRIEHKTQEDKKEFEKKLDEALRKRHYRSRTEWVKEKAREIISQTEGG